MAILEDYFDEGYADKLFESSKKWLIDLKIGLTNNPKDWIEKNMPLGPKYGMYQSIISHCPGFWELREQMYELFTPLGLNLAPVSLPEIVFTILTGREDLLTSIDGASIYPSLNKPNRVRDWAHIDRLRLSRSQVANWV